MSSGLIALIITILAIIFAIKTKKCFEILLIASVIVAIFAFKWNFLNGWITAICEEVSNNTWLWLMCGLFGSLTALFEESKSVQYFSKAIAKLCKTKRLSLFATFLTGLVIFTDDYLNIITVPLCMKRTYDKNKISRETLAYLTDCTGTPVCTIVPVSSWAAFYGSLFFGYSFIASNYTSPINLYLSIIPYMFYPILTLLVALLFCFGVFPASKQMQKFSNRQTIGISANEDSIEKGSIIDFVLPMLVLIIVSLVADEILIGIAISLFVCFLLYVPSKKVRLSDFVPICIKGFCKMMPIMFLLTACYTFKNITSQMGMSEYIVNLFSGILTPSLLPMLSFIICALLSFSTGVVWGTSVISVPMILPLAQSLGANLLLVMAAIISGGIFGAQACIYADTTVISANSCDITPLEHLSSELPYIAIPAIISLVLYTVFGLT